jgi:hypothetical protein
LEVLEEFSMAIRRRYSSLSSSLSSGLDTDVVGTPRAPKAVTLLPWSHSASWRVDVDVCAA